VLLPNLDQDTYSVHFARFAAKLEKHLLNHGIACSEADVIIEDSSTIFFDKLNNPKKSLMKLFKKQDPMSLFIESASESLQKHIPEAQKTFGSYRAIEDCLR
jgi:hypothetical protein